MASNRARTSLVAAAVLALSAAALTADCATSRPPTTAVPLPLEAFTTQTIHAGVTFRASLDVALSSESTKEGQWFTATLLVPLDATDGSTVAPKGAKLRGQVLAVERDGVNRMVLRFESVEVREHFLPIHAQVMRIESVRVAPSNAADPDSTAVSVYPLRPPELSGTGVGGGPPPEQLPLALETGAYVELYLSRPMVVGRTTRVDEP